MSSDRPSSNADRWNRVFHALSAALRREVIVALNDAPPDERVSLPGSIVCPPDRNEEAIRAKLHHSHLPVLAERDYVEWEPDPLRAWRGPAFDEVNVVLQELAERTHELPEQLVADCPHLEARASD
ncbi:hypothetical protein [Halomicrobium salinisoli]|uniref:hypothetical protein n=1 Tax=Halomicrobium salinisoli TaxID=2878391 RepID=UPI001CF0856E|nr:hypothetical protein [Halomicrobium salinisoli]